MNNSTDSHDDGPKWAKPDTICTFTDFGDPVESGWAMPTGGTFHPMGCQ